MSARRTSVSRGQATVELVLGLLVFVTVLIFGIHFAEVGYLSLKVTEASASALWDATAYKVHELPRSSPGPAIARAELDTRRRYRDFDGRTSADNATTLTQVFTRASGMEVVCRGGAGLDGDPVINPAWRVINDNGGMACSAQAALSAVNIPVAFMERSGDGFFATRHLVRTAPITICAAGRALNGSCRGEYRMLIDDWGLAQDREALDCPVQAWGPCSSGNMPFYEVSGQIFLRNGAGQGAFNGFAAERLASQAVGASPMFGLTEMFYMSYMGEESMFTQPLWVGEGAPIWQTTPFLTPSPTYSVSYFERSGNGGCYLGLKCDQVFQP